MYKLLFLSLCSFLICFSFAFCSVNTDSLIKMVSSELLRVCSVISNVYSRFNLVFNQGTVAMAPLVPLLDQSVRVEQFPAEILT